MVNTESLDMKALIKNLEEEMQELSKKRKDLLDKLDKSYTKKQRQLLDDLEKTLNQISYDKEKLRKLYARAVIPDDERNFGQKFTKMGQRWTKNEDAELKKEFENGKSIIDLAEAFKRTPLSIQFRLYKLGLIEEAPDVK